MGSCVSIPTKLESINNFYFFSNILCSLFNNAKKQFRKKERMETIFSNPNYI
jgi:hypothetical protein